MYKIVWIDGNGNKYSDTLPLTALMQKWEDPTINIISLEVVQSKNSFKKSALDKN